MHPLTLVHSQIKEGYSCLTSHCSFRIQAVGSQAHRIKTLALKRFYTLALAFSEAAERLFSRSPFLKNLFTRLSAQLKIKIGRVPLSPLEKVAGRIDQQTHPGRPGVGSVDKEEKPTPSLLEQLQGELQAKRQKKSLPSLQFMISLFELYFDKKSSTFSPKIFSLFDLNAFLALLSAHHQAFPLVASDKNVLGIIQKADLPEGSRLFVAADLHGDLRSLLDNLIILQRVGMLDDCFCTKPNCYLIFLGDYMDRGFCEVQVLEILILLQLTNPKSVVLLRGNHEDYLITKDYALKGSPKHVMLSSSKAVEALKHFFFTLPLSHYVATQGKNRQYTQFSHGLFEFSKDPSKLLDHEGSPVFTPVLKSRSLSDRVYNLARRPPTNSPKEQKLIRAAKRIEELFSYEDWIFACPFLTTYNWGDVNMIEDPSHKEFNKTITDSPGDRAWKLNAEDIKHYFRLSSDKHKVKHLFRGHQHCSHIAYYNNKPLVTTLPLTMETEYAKRGWKGQRGKTLILTIRPLVKEWEKTPLIQENGQYTLKATRKLGEDRELD